MNFTGFAALVRRDIRLFFMDRRAVVMSFVAPILIASFFGYLFGGVTKENAAKITVAAVDQDGSEVSHKVIAALAADKTFEVKERPLDEARQRVRGGKDSVALVFPKGFGERAPQALFRPGEKPEIQLLYDPSHATEVQVVRGMLTQYVMETVSRQAMTGSYVDTAVRELDQATGMSAPDKAALRSMLSEVSKWNQRQQSSAGGASGGGFSMPYTLRDEAVTAHKGTPYNSMAHSFAGMCVQFILFMGIDAGMVVLYQRRTGLWKRLRAAPLSRFTLIGSRATSAAMIAMLIMLVVFGFARVVFGVRIEGSFAGFLGVCASFALMTAMFGLLVSVAGKTPEATRGIAILVTLVLVMLGGSWVPTFIFPQWLQKLTVAIPTRWAVDGLDGVVWRGFDFNASLQPIGALLGFAVLFGAIAVWRFRWESES
jgi:ABC-type multidrug transport system permease subunit